MTLEVISIKKSIFKGEVDSLVVPGANGLFTILPRHVSIMSILTKGDIVYTIGEKDYRVAIESGFIEVCNNVVIICVGETIDPKYSGKQIVTKSDGEEPSASKSNEKSEELERGENAEKD